MSYGNGRPPNDDGRWYVNERGVWLHPEHGRWWHSPSRGWIRVGDGGSIPAAVPTKKKSGIGAGWIVAMFVVGAGSCAACDVAPTISPIGWILIVGLYMIAKHLERIEDQLASDAYDREHPNRFDDLEP